MNESNFGDRSLEHGEGWNEGILGEGLLGGEVHCLQQDNSDTVVLSRICLNNSCQGPVAEKGCVISKNYSVSHL